VNYRQVFIDGTEKQCQHTQLRKAFSEGGDVIAEECSACGIQLAVRGDCKHCTRRGLMTKWRKKKTTFWLFCNGTCETAFDVEEKARQKEAKSA
jgi:hypothetical protein